VLNAPGWENLRNSTEVAVYLGNGTRSPGVVNMWNSLSSYVVSAESVNCFKNRLDNFWKDQEIIYNFRAEIYGTGNRSEVTV